MSDLTAGRELDALVAEKVMGVVGRQIVYAWVDRKSRQAPLVAFAYAGFSTGLESSFASYVNEAGEKLDRGITFARLYSTDIASAWLVVEKLVAEGCEVEVERSPSGGSREPAGCTVSKGWHSNATATDGHFDVIEYETAASVPLAICLAALKAVSASGSAPVEARPETNLQKPTFGFGQTPLSGTLTNLAEPQEGSPNGR